MKKDASMVPEGTLVEFKDRVSGLFLRGRVLFRVGYARTIVEVHNSRDGMDGFYLEPEGSLREIAQDSHGQTFETPHQAERWFKDMYRDVKNRTKMSDAVLSRMLDYLVREIDMSDLPDVIQARTLLLEQVGPIRSPKNRERLYLRIMIRGLKKGR